LILSNSSIIGSLHAYEERSWISYPVMFLTMAECVHSLGVFIWVTLLITVYCKMYSRGLTIFQQKLIDLRNKGLKKERRVRASKSQIVPKTKHSFDEDDLDDNGLAYLGYNTNSPQINLHDSKFLENMPNNLDSPIRKGREIKSRFNGGTETTDKGFRINLARQVIPSIKPALNSQQSELDNSSIGLLVKSGKFSNNLEDKPI